MIMQPAIGLLASAWFYLSELTVLVWARFYPHTGQETSHYCSREKEQGTDSSM